ncbi:MAG: diguanylate phosphodiesterase [Nitrospirae bacterium GWC2_57_13]|jgi:transcriptional regulator with GAF, ATPase, and Fis domain|nr:MAG: diguanylate phosphodiesterase [Nitrospirae bacterium GWC2_57_13]OGW43740.1 MAG: diguanylate phosphodiesterase [Nitrospirae bacterium GWD2_57_8]HAR45630.1 diguanylate phosphodiesterase [Nitrospiraceae bacterium]
MDKDSNTLNKKVEEFLQVFRKGEEFTHELLTENERLRYRVAQLEEVGKFSGRDENFKLKTMEERLQFLEDENKSLLDRYRLVEKENQDFANRYVEVESENNNLANLYVASYQLHSTLDFNESLKIILEIIMNLVGAEEFAIMMLDEKTHELSIVAQEGMGQEARPSIKLGAGIIGGAAKSSEAFYRDGDPTNLKGVDYTHPLVCIPLKIKEHVIGVLVIYKLLVQKASFSDVDYELFSMLAGHAATSIFSSKLYSQSERKLTTIQSFLDLLKEK